MGSTSTHVASGEATLHVSTWGAKGPALLALHPGVGDSRSWNSCAPLWVSAGHRVVAYDRRGFGRTEARPEPHDDLTDLLAVIEATDVDSAVAVGSSRGGGLALDLAVAHPDRVTALVLIAPSPSGYDYGNWPTATAEAEQDALTAAADEAGDLDLVNRLETRYWLDGVEQVEGRVSGPARALFTEMNRTALGASPIGEAVARPPVWPVLSSIEVPALVVAGDFDLPGIQQQCRELVAAMPNADYVEIAGSAHCPQLDQPEALTSMVLDFLGQQAST